MPSKSVYEKKAKVSSFLFSLMFYVIAMAFFIEYIPSNQVLLAKNNAIAISYSINYGSEVIQSDEDNDIVEDVKLPESLDVAEKILKDEPLVAEVTEKKILKDKPKKKVEKKPKKEHLTKNSANSKKSEGSASTKSKLVSKNSDNNSSETSFDDNAFEKDFIKLIEKNKKYPEKAIKMGLVGQVKVKVSFNTLGEIESITIIKGQHHKLLEEAALKTMNKIKNKWKPVNRPKAAKTLIIPINYELKK